MMNMTMRNTWKRLTSKYWSPLLISVFVLITIIIAAICYLGSRSTVDINRYVKINQVGYDGYGSIELSIDYNSLIDDCFVGDEKIGDTKNEVLEMCHKFNPFNANYNMSNNLSNGDVVDIRWDKNGSVIREVEKLLGVTIRAKPFQCKIVELNDLQDYNPFDDLVIQTNNTISGVGTIEFSINPSVENTNIVWRVSHDGINGSIKNGDVLTLTMDSDIDFDSFTRNTGLKVSKTSEEHTVTCLAEYVKDETLLQNIGQKEQDIFDGVVNDWVVSGLNDENKLMRERTYKSVGHILYTNNTDVDQSSESMLINIYRINDKYVLGGYYVFIGLKGKFSFSTEGVFVNNGESLPTSFVYYEKETVRYSEKFGWGQDYESMGFLYLETPYAGHMDIEETFNYIESVYGVNYSARYCDDNIDSMIPAR